MLNRMFHDTSGNVLPILAVAIPVLIIAIGLGVDTTYNMFVLQKMQRTSDSAALSASRSYMENSSVNLDNEALFIAQKAGFNLPGTGSIKVNYPPTSGTNAGAAGFMEVIFQQPQSVFFGRAFGTTAGTLRTRSLVQFSSSDAPCIEVLATSGASAFSGSGGSSVNAQGCDIYVNSNHASALGLTGGASVVARSAYVTGGINVSNTSSLVTSNETKTNVAPKADIFASLNPPAFGGCDYTSYSVTSSVTLNPGVYCQGLTVNSGATVYLNPGIYYIDRGKFSVNGGATLVGTGVTIVLTSSTGSGHATVSLMGTSTLDISAPTEGPLAGIAFFGDRGISYGTKQTFNGGSGMRIEGAVYFPTGQISWAGSGVTNTSCTILVAWNIAISGNARFTNNCGSFGVAATGGTSVLVE